MPLSSPAPVGDAETATPIQDANAFLIEALRLIRYECSPRVALMASEVLGVLSDHDGMRIPDLKAAVLESLELRLVENRPVNQAIEELLRRSVIAEAEGRLSLNPAVAALISREAE